MRAAHVRSLWKRELIGKASDSKLGSVILPEGWGVTAATRGRLNRLGRRAKELSKTGAWGPR
ncbi:hypothetical protein MPNT_60111 [Candidatus Methylacidithermus pantelleriae]|uniref:Uncharacterized protein n=1 Tax=Candidatus Methylacidithermus pantelleriae TaxID=2744239 RepID=A0A8J2BSB6_9BACT|nr:hypothetical protein MPNT_60111 [Candidatus Methylacidithermus pantelleriae]